MLIRGRKLKRQAEQGRKYQKGDRGASHRGGKITTNKIPTIEGGTEKQREEKVKRKGKTIATRKGWS